MNKFSTTYSISSRYKEYLVTIYGSYKPKELYDRLTKLQMHFQKRGFLTGFVEDYDKLNNETNLEKSLRFTDLSTINIFIFLLKKRSLKPGSSGIFNEYPSIITNHEISKKSFAIFEDRVSRFFPNTSLVEEHLEQAVEKPLYDTFLIGDDEQLLKKTEKYFDEILYKKEKGII